MNARILMASAALFASACSQGTRGVQVGSPPQSAAPAQPAATFTRVTLERRPCFGTCPTYVVTISGDGSVVFDGRTHVDSMRGSGRVSANQLRTLERAFDEHGYYGMDPQYIRGTPGCGSYASDAPTVITSITGPTRSKRIEHSLGCSGAPPALEKLEALIAEIAGVSRWVGRR